MARVATPWYWEERQGWYVTKDGRRHFLGEHPQGAPQPRKYKGRWSVPEPITLAFHDLMAKRPPVIRPADDGLTVAEVYDKYLAWCRQHRAPLTYECYQEFIQGLIDHLGSNALLPAMDLRPFHISEWVDSHTTWGPTRRRNAIVNVQRPFNCAFKLGYIRDNPVRYLEKPQAQRRENHVTPEDFEKILAEVPDQQFRDLFMFTWETGCRPQEIRIIAARHVNLAGRRIEIPPAEAKGRKRWRIIRLSNTALEIIQRLMVGNTRTTLFLNIRGEPWKAYALVCRFQRLKEKLGKRFALYDLRHGFANRKLVLLPKTLAALAA